MNEFREGKKKEYDFLLKSEDFQCNSADWRRN